MAPKEMHINYFSSENQISWNIVYIHRKCVSESVSYFHEKFQFLEKKYYFETIGMEVKKILFFRNLYFLAYVYTYVYINSCERNLIVWKLILHKLLMLSNIHLGNGINGNSSLIYLPFLGKLNILKFLESQFWQIRRKTFWYHRVFRMEFCAPVYKYIVTNSRTETVNSYCYRIIGIYSSLALFHFKYKYVNIWLLIIV